MNPAELPYARNWPGPAGPPFICLHAVGGSHAHWLGVAPELARYRRVLAIDLAGCGRTPAIEGAGIEANQRLISRLLEDTGPAILIGSSIGGAIAMLQAGREPESVTALVLSGSLFPVRDGESHSARAALVRRRMRQRVHGARIGARSLRDGSLRLRRDSLVAHMIRGSAAERDSIDPELIEVCVAVDRLRTPRQSVNALIGAGRSVFRLLSQPAIFEQVLDGVGRSVLVLHGGQDRTAPMQYARAAARGRPGWALVSLDDLGHLPHMEAPQVWLSEVQRWVSGTGR